jgi:hypothetical protein
MIWPLAETLRLIEPYVPAQLVAPELFARIKTVAAQLPDAMSAYFLECRLGPEASQVDFLTCITALNGARQVLAEQDIAAVLPSRLLTQPLWGRIYEFWKQWADPASPLYEQIPLTWLEFEQLDGQQPTMPLACPTFCLDREILQRKHPLNSANGYNPQQGYQVAEVALEYLLGQPLSPLIKKNLLACFEALPPGGRIIHLGSMQTRQPPVLKVYGLLPRQGLLAYLAAIGWPGSPAEIENILTTFGPTTAIARPDLALGASILPRMGLEFSHPASPQDDQTQQRLLNQCVAAGLCTPEKRDALLTWPGSSRETFSRFSWPVRLRRWLDLKIVYQPDQLLEAKAYLGFSPRFSLF